MCLQAILSKITFRKIFILCFLACCCLLIGSHIIESFFYVIPCQLCILQRFTYYSLGILFITGVIHNPKNIGRYIYILHGLFLSLIGLLFSGRQIWMQHLPIDQTPECTPGLGRLFEMLPLLEAIKTVFNSSSECNAIHFTVLYVPLSNWSFICFVCFSITCVIIMYAQKKRWI